jgi:hypothetical protein
VPVPQLLGDLTDKLVASTSARHAELPREGTARPVVGSTPKGSGQLV